MITGAFIYMAGFAATFYASYANEIDHDTVTLKEAALYGLFWPFFAALFAIAYTALAAGRLWNKFRKLTSPFILLRNSRGA